MTTMIELLELDSDQRSTQSCPPYEPGEVRDSRTLRGHLQPDVVAHARGLVIADFGVNWGTPKASVRTEPALRDWLRTTLRVVEANPSTTLQIRGYTDCRGGADASAVLRRRRATKVRHLLRSMAGGRWHVLEDRVTFVGAAPPAEYLSDNDSVAGRALNRGVLLRTERTVELPPERVVSPDTLERIVRRSRDLVREREHFGLRISGHQQARIRCWLQRAGSSSFDDRIITAQGVLDYMNRNRLYFARAEKWLLPDHAVRRRVRRTDEQIWRSLAQIDEMVIAGRHKINFYYSHGAATPHAVRRLRGWVAGREADPRSIYHCYGPQGP